MFGPADEAVCRALWVELTERHRLIYESPSIGGSDPAADFDSLLADSRLAGIWLAEVDGQVVGMAGLLLDGGEAEVEPIVVTEQHRSRGVGARLLEELRREALARGVAHLTIRPVARNVDAIRAFHRAGFNILGHIDMFMDLRENQPTWKEGVEVHGFPFDF